MDGIVEPLWGAVSRHGGFAEQIHWFRADGRSIRVKKGCGSKNIRIRVDTAFKIQLFTLFPVIKTLKLSADRHFFTDNKQLFRFPLASRFSAITADQSTKKTRANLRRRRHSVTLLILLRQLTIISSLNGLLTQRPRVREE